MFSSPRRLRRLGEDHATEMMCSNWNATAPLSDMEKLQEDMTNKYIPPLKALAPESGVYMNEVRSEYVRVDK